MLEYLFHITRQEAFPKASHDFPHCFLAVDLWGTDTECAQVSIFAFE